MRTRYETQKNLDEEKAVAESAGKALGMTFLKAPEQYRLDYMVIAGVDPVKRGRPVIGFAEVKCRNYTMERIAQLGGYHLSSGKWAHAAMLCAATGVDFMLIVRTTDGLYMLRMNPGAFERFALASRRHPGDFMCIGGRFDRDDWQDVEPMVSIPPGAFRRLDGPVLRVV